MAKAVTKKAPVTKQASPNVSKKAPPEDDMKAVKPTAGIMLFFFSNNEYNFITVWSHINPICPIRNFLLIFADCYYIYRDLRPHAL